MWVDIAGDAAAAAGFYPALFGWRVREHGACYLGDRAVAGIRAARPGAWVPSLPVDDVTAARARIVRAGGRVRPDGLLTDPLGATFGLVARGAAAVDEPGAPVWAEHRGRDLAAARRFYQHVFGYLYQQAGPAGYVTFQAHTGGLALGGLGHASRAHAAWFTYFSVADTDVAVAEVVALGGRVCAPARDSEFGRVATVADNQGAEFVLVATARSDLLTQTDKPIVTICG